MTFAERLRAGETIYSNWSMVGSIPLVNQLALADFSAIVVDMQHGTHSDDTMIACAEAIARSGKIAITRIPVDCMDIASRALDVGYEAVIAPMINCKQDAEELVLATKYPPLGQRSWGATRAMQLHGETSTASQLANANTRTVTLPMIETIEAYEALDDILSVDGIDGVFVGPSDFSISFTNGAELNPRIPKVEEAIADIAARARAKGKFTGIFSSDPTCAGLYAKMGYQFINISTDISLIKAGAEHLITKAGINTSTSEKAGY